MDGTALHEQPTNRQSPMCLMDATPPRIQQYVLFAPSSRAQRKQVECERSKSFYLSAEWNKLHITRKV